VKKKDFLKFFDGLTVGRIKAFVYKVCGGDILLFKQILGDNVKVEIKDDRFILYKSFDVTIPEDYDYHYGFSRFWKETDSVGRKWDPSDYLSKKLILGKIYTINLYEVIHKDVRPIYGMWFLKRQKAIFVGIEGLSVLWSLARGQFSDGMGVISFDYCDKLDNGDIEYNFTASYMSKDATFRFSAGIFPRERLDQGYLLLCINQK
jgi:hypothetical protein